ncbi:MAG TPA: SRPBCC family protein [Blastocatellia bacterium]|nr:SRPBCC family protein [Blastocatellia bacterium]
MATNEKSQRKGLTARAHIDRHRNGGLERLARGLGWFSLGLGLAEVAAPRELSRLIGIRGDHDRVIRAMGMREISHGLGILIPSRPATAVWTRVGGDVMDLAFLGAAYSRPRIKQERLVTATAAVAGVAALDLYCAWQLTRNGGRGAIDVQKSVIVNRAPEELYRFWRSFQNLPNFMAHLESVQTTGANRSHWVARGPAGKRIEWDAEITEDRPNQLIAWRSVENAKIDHSCSVRFERAPGGRGTVVKLEMHLEPPGGALGKAMAKLFNRVPELQVQEDLRRFKRLIETGEIITTEGQPAGRSDSRSWKYDLTGSGGAVKPEPPKGRSAISR